MSLTSTSVLLAAVPNPSTYGSSVVLTATITPASLTEAITGTVDFFDSGTFLAAAGRPSKSP